MELSKSRLNLFTALFSLAASFFVYVLSMADTVPYWDSGEFIATSYILGVPHPPGSPLYLIIGRIFSMLPINPDIAFRVNLISPVVSAFAVMFLYLSCVKLISSYRGKVKSQIDSIVVFRNPRSANQCSFTTVTSPRVYFCNSHLITLDSI